MALEQPEQLSRATVHVGSNGKLSTLLEKPEGGYIFVLI